MKLDKKIQERVVQLREANPELSQEEAVRQATAEIGSAEERSLALRNPALSQGQVRDLLGKQKFLRVQQNNINVIWDNPALLKKYEGCDEIRQFLKQIEFCSAVAIGFYGAAGRLPLDMTMERLVSEYLVNKEKAEIVDTHPDEQAAEVLRLRARVRALERLIHDGGPGRGYTD